MHSIRRCSVVVSALVVCASLARAQGGVPDLSARTAEILDWAAPPYWNPPPQPISVQEREGGVRTEGVSASSTSPLPFIGVNPCRLVDTRQAGFPAGYGPPALVGGLPRNFDLNDDPLCPGIPASVGAYSLNITVTNTQGPGFILIYPQGGAQPPVSTLNYVASQTIANAAIVPAQVGGGVTVIAGVSGADLIIDINGYYAPAGVGIGNTFLGFNAGNFTMTGSNNTGIGASALHVNTAGGDNTASGNGALANNTTGDYNTACGSSALLSNTVGNNNTASGYFALYSNTIGTDNTASGKLALSSNTAGGFNTAIGVQALRDNTTGAENTAVGYLALPANVSGGGNVAFGLAALQNNTTGAENTAVGPVSLVFNTTGSRNIAVGFGAGFNLTTGDDNIDIADGGFAGESSTIRIGIDGVQTRTFLAGIRGVTTGANDAVPVLVDSAGQLGTVSSSRRVKEDIEDMSDRTDRLLQLRPVTFRYKPELDPSGELQYGLIAEEVAEVFQELVVYDREGQPETVRYHVLPSLLLNEVQKQHRTIEEQKTEIEALKARLSRLEARLEARQ